MSEIFERLSAPFPIEAVSWRLGATNGDKTKGIALAYLDARDVMDRFDAVCGPDGWQCRYSNSRAPAVCEIGVKSDGEWIWKSDGAGDTDVEAEKGALSDAFKRAAVRWGVGRYLYGLGNTWVEIEPAGRSHKIKESERPKLHDALQRITDAVEWGTPGERVTLKTLMQTIRTCLTTEDDVRRYRELNDGMIAQLRVRPRALVNEVLDKIADGSLAQTETIRTKKAA